MGKELSRRQMLAGTGVGAVTVWTAPAVTRIGLAPAAAGSIGLCPTPNIGPFEGVTTFTYAGQLTGGADLTENGASAYSDNTTGFIFNETGPVEIPPGGYQSETTFIPAGTLVCSVYVHGSPTSQTQRYRATIDFGGIAVLGYDGRAANLQNSDPLFAVPGVDYDGRGRSHEWTGNADFFDQPASNTVRIRMRVGDNFVDHGRIFVACL